MNACQMSTKDRYIHYSIAEARILVTTDNTRSPHGGSHRTDERVQAKLLTNTNLPTNVVDLLLKLSCILLVRIIYKSIRISKLQTCTGKVGTHTDLVLKGFGRGGHNGD